MTPTNKQQGASITKIDFDYGIVRYSSRYSDFRSKSDRKKKKKMFVLN